MSDLSNEIIEQISFLAIEVGHEIVVREMVEGSFDDNDPGAGSVLTPSDTTVTGAIVPVGESFKGGVTVVEKDDKLAIISLYEETLTIDVGMYIVDGTDEYKIVEDVSPEINGDYVTAFLLIRK